MRHAFVFSFVILQFLSVLHAANATKLTDDQRADLDAIRQEISSVQVLIDHSKFDEAISLFTKLVDQLSNSGINKNDPTFKRLTKQMRDLRRKLPFVGPDGAVVILIGDFPSTSDAEWKAPDLPIFGVDKVVFVNSQRKPSVPMVGANLTIQAGAIIPANRLFIETEFELWESNNRVTVVQKNNLWTLVGTIPIGIQLKHPAAKKTLFSTTRKIPLIQRSKVGQQVDYTKLRREALESLLSNVNTYLGNQLARRTLVKSSIIAVNKKPTIRLQFRNGVAIGITGNAIVKRGAKSLTAPFTLAAKSELTADVDISEMGGFLEMRALKKQIEIGFDNIELSLPGSAIGASSVGVAAMASGESNPGNERPPAKIVMADGSETISFTKDIAPFMSNLCVRCHRGNNPRGGYSMETFEKLMQGGDSGVVVVGGDLDASRMWDLAGKQKPIKMPPGQALITRSNHANLKKWIREGAKFDGKDAKAPLSRLVPSATDTKLAELAKMSTEEFEKRRTEQADAMWKRVMSKEAAKQVATDDFMVYGNVSESRLKEIAGWSDEHAGSLRNMFGEKNGQLWRGRLIVFVAGDRFAYEEFNQVLLRRRSPKELTGHSVVTAGFDDAYIVVQDIGDTVASDSIGMKLTLLDHLTGAFLKRGGGNLPDWLVRGTGLVLAAQAEPKNPYIQSLPISASKSIKALNRPDAVFNDGTFSPGEIGGVGYTLVSFLFKQGGAPKFGRLVKQLNDGTKPNDAFKSVYGAAPGAISQRLIQAL